VHDHSEQSQITRENPQSPHLWREQPS